MPLRARLIRPCRQHAASTQSSGGKGHWQEARRCKPTGEIMRHSHISKRHLVGLVLAVYSLIHSLGFVGWSADLRAAKREEKAATPASRAVSEEARAGLAATLGNLP